MPSVWHHFFLILNSIYSIQYGIYRTGVIGNLDLVVKITSNHLSNKVYSFKFSCSAMDWDFKMNELKMTHCGGCIGMLEKIRVRNDIISKKVAVSRIGEDEKELFMLV